MTIWDLFKKISDSNFRCSDGADRLREHWEENGCSTFNISQAQVCQSFYYRVEAGEETTNHNPIIAIPLTLVLASVIIVVVLISSYYFFYYKKSRIRKRDTINFVALEMNATTQ